MNESLDRSAMPNNTSDKSGFKNSVTGPGIQAKTEDSKNGFRNTRQ